MVSQLSDASDNAPAAPDIALAFDLAGDLASVKPFVGGNINESYMVHCTGAPYLLQRLNPAVFREPRLVMENVARTCHHLAKRLRHDHPDSWRRRVLQLVPTHEGALWHVDMNGTYWRCYHFIEGTHVRTAIASPREARHAGAAFATFAREIAEMPGGPLHETIPSFHDTRRHYEALLAAAEDAPSERRQAATEELAFYREREEWVDRLNNALDSDLVHKRPTHNDTKVDNLLLDQSSNEVLCVVDLDTTMPGLLAYDYGDLVRTVTSPVPEDHPRPDEVVMQPTIFEELTEGYLSAAAGMMSDEERHSLMWGARLMPMEVGVRFLTDYLAGDVYFRTAYPKHNLIRSRAQIALLTSIEANWARVDAALS